MYKITTIFLYLNLIKKLAIYFPSELHILTSSSTLSGGTLKSFSMNIDDFFAPDSPMNDSGYANGISEDMACLRFENSWNSHLNKIANIFPRASGEFIASCDEKGNVIIWKIEPSRVFLSFFVLYISRKNS